MSSHDSDDAVFERVTPGSPKPFDGRIHHDSFIHHHQRMARGSADHGIIYHHHEGTPDSPISQVTFIALKTLNSY